MAYKLRKMVNKMINDNVDWGRGWGCFDCWNLSFIVKLLVMALTNLVLDLANLVFVVIQFYDRIIIVFLQPSYNNR